MFRLLAYAWRQPKWYLGPMVAIFTNMQAARKRRQSYMARYLETDKYFQKVAHLVGHLPISPLN